ncbi:Cysteinyl-tRNA synthetase [Methylophaga frappieri]|uniref:Cysteinyl-tRNA synthetase n=1 Tax=Methylophaga frappieri (strain ATCC BAA-2434 / DSM 25690 / JAM7) TaxID=754477 RepID=I1YG91_METFJ|nr:sodium:proton symporter [Methylophaga frappieri]AFJ01934.1 Cysteinyl-tRNA synthetase [Methylophaga frappieri]
MLNLITPIYRNGLGLTALLLLTGIVVGSVTGYLAPNIATYISDFMDPTLFVLIVLLFFTIRFNPIITDKRKLKFIAIAVIANFVFVPLIGFAIASVFLNHYPLFMLGLMIYFMSPCTDWFLGFTRLCRGDTMLGAALMPINMTLQLLLFPLFLYLFSQNIVELETGIITDTLLNWFIEPVLIALTARLALKLVLNHDQITRLLDKVNRLIPFIIALLIMQIFAGNIDVLLGHIDVFIWMLLAVFCFFVLTFMLSEFVSKRFSLPYSEHVLLTMTVAARNAPLMLAVTMVVLPSQPLIYAAIVIGMLLEFPHLTLLSHLLMRSSHSKTAERLA